MITLRRANERHLDRYHKQEARFTFDHQEQANTNDGCFGALENLSENRLPPAGISVARPSQETEIVTYIYRGALAQQHSTGLRGVIRAGEFQRMTTGRGIHNRETNASRTDWVHFFRISLRPSEAGPDRAPEQIRSAAAERRNVLSVVASPDGRQGSLRIRQDALVCSSVLDPGQHVVHELFKGRSAWLHVIHGSATLDGLILTQGDGVGVTVERSVSFTALEETEILLVDLATKTHE